MVARMHFDTVSLSNALLALALALLGFNSCVAMRRAQARGDVLSAVFVAASTLLLLALLATVRAGGRRREQLKAVAWALSSTLTVMFAHRVAALAPAPSLAVLVWSMAAATVGSGFCLLFLHDRVVLVAGRQDA